MGAPSRLEGAPATQPGAPGYVAPAPPGTPLGPNEVAGTPTPWDEEAAEERREEAERERQAARDKRQETEEDWEEAEEERQEREEEAEHERWLHQRDPNVIAPATIVPRFGLTLGGFGKSQVECVGDCFGLGGDTTYVHRTNLVVQFTGLFRVGRMLRIGPGMTYRAPARVDTERHNRVVLGTMLSLDLEGEVAYPIAEKMWLAPRGEVSFLQLFAEDDTEARLDAIHAACARAPQPQQCDREPAFGLGGAAGVGWIYGGVRARLRLDLLASFYWIDLGTYEAQSEQLRWTLTGVRSELFVGGDFL